MQSCAGLQWSGTEGRACCEKNPGSGVKTVTRSCTEAFSAGGAGTNLPQLVVGIFSLSKAPDIPWVGQGGLWRQLGQGACGLRHGQAPLHQSTRHSHPPHSSMPLCLRLLCSTQSSSRCFCVVSCRLPPGPHAQQTGTAVHRGDLATLRSVSWERSKSLSETVSELHGFVFNCQGHQTRAAGGQGGCAQVTELLCCRQDPQLGSSASTSWGGLKPGLAHSNDDSRGNISLILFMEGDSKRPDHSESAGPVLSCPQSGEPSLSQSGTAEVPEDAPR